MGQIGCPILYSRPHIHGRIISAIQFLDGSQNFITLKRIMNTKKLFITILFISIQIANGQNHPDTIDHTQEHIQFLEDFYTKYISIGYNLSSKDFLEEYCTKKLLCEISESKIDYDPFIFAQDISPIVLDYLRVEKYGAQKNIYEVSFHYLNEGENDRTRIRLEVINTTEGCKVSDIISVYDPEVGLHYPLGR